MSLVFLQGNIMPQWGTVLQWHEYGWDRSIQIGFSIGTLFISGVKLIDVQATYIRWKTSKIVTPFISSTWRGGLFPMQDFEPVSSCLMYCTISRYNLVQCTQGFQSCRLAPAPVASSNLPLRSQKIRTFPVTSGGQSYSYLLVTVTETLGLK